MSANLSPATPHLAGTSGAEAFLRESARTASGPYLRPFTPAAGWRTARVFVVGTNPATPLRDEFASFDEYWHALTTDPASFDAVYRAHRGGKSSKTTARIARFEAPLRDVGVLRTNACALPSRRWLDLRAAERRSQLENGLLVLRALVAICRPAAILAHGSEGVRAVSRLFGVPLDPYVPLLAQSAEARLPAGMQPVQLFAYPHLSGVGVNKGFAVARMGDDLEALGHRLAASLRPGDGPVSSDR
ncbi:hypothetical protein [Massilia timonae]|uniref:hypothetical protein n=1 Tax=Massilia timonae TaxID=47229 RepID=UPI00289F2080|nr:hypothetical protein [Massilia timonae]